jgi:hypothetical protein
LKKRSSFSQTVSPPKTTTITAVKTWMRLILPVSFQRIAMEARRIGTKAAVTMMNPS